jgi:hypothetical protein
MARIEAAGNNDLTGALMDVIGEIGDLPENLADQAFKQLIGESVVNVPQAAATAAGKTQGVVSNRLDRIREVELENLTPPAAAKISTASGPAGLGVVRE